MEKVSINLRESPSHSKNALKRDKSIYISILIHPSQSVGQQSKQRWPSLTATSTSSREHQGVSKSAERYSWYSMS